MASIYDIAGTINDSFTIGNNGITIFHGTSIPTLDIGKLGDIYVLDNYVYEIEIPRIDENGEPILDENGEPDTTKEFTSRPVGRIYYRCIVDGVECWEHIKNYSFDEPIINVLETSDMSNNYRISIQKALQPNEDPNSTTENDFEVAHDNYGVVRFSTDNEAKGGKRVDTVINPKQLIDNINDLIAKHNVATDTHKDIRQAIVDETNRALAAEKVLQDNINKEQKRAEDAEKVLQDNIDTEENSRIDADNNLQSQIDAINARKDVIDILGTYEELLTYENEYLSDGDIIKILNDSQHDNRQSYYKWSQASSAWEYIGSDSASYTIAESDALLKLKADLESPKLTGTPTTPTASLTSNDKTIANTEFTQALVKQYDDTNVHLTGDETIDGVKTFNDTIIATQNGAIVDVQHNGTSVSNISTVSNESANSIAMVINDENGAEVGSVELIYDKEQQETYLSIPGGSAATQEWVNDPTKSTNVVHRTGDEEINGLKEFKTIPQVPTATLGTKNLKVANTEYVQNELELKQDKIQITSSDTNKFLSNDGEYLEWREIKDITELQGLFDVNIEEPQDGQVLIYDADKKKWVNGLQTTATIKYW